VNILSVYKTVIMNLVSVHHFTPSAHQNRVVLQPENAYKQCSNACTPSVKIANRAAEKQRPQNEPFGQSGTRCALFNQDIEEPFGVGDVYNSGQEIRDFNCQVNGPREAGRYNLSVALLGSEMMNDWNMNMGESHVSSAAYLTDHLGISYMLHHVATVTSVFPSRAGMQGGTRLTIQGNGFSNDKANVQVRVGGERCAVAMASMTRIECVLVRRGSAHNTSFAAGEAQPGARGVLRRIWWRRGCSKSIEDLRDDAELLDAPDVAELEMSKVESEVNVMYARGESEGPHMTYTGFFRAPVSGNYSFLLSADDYAQLRVGSRANVGAATELLIDWRSWVGSREWEREQWNRGRYHNPIDKVDKAKMMRASRKVELLQGEFLFLEAHYRSCGGGDNFALALVQHNRLESS